MTVDLDELIGEQTEVFWWLYLSKKRNIISQGGTSSSKTYSQMQLFALKAVTEKNKVFTVVGQDLPNMRVGVMRDFSNIITGSKLLKTHIARHNKSTHQYEFKSGSVIEFRSYENSQDAKSGKRDYAFFNEANGIAEDIFDEIADRTSEQVYLDFNPNQRCWIHTKFENDNDAVTFISNFTHNQFVSPAIIKSLLKYKISNPHRWRVFGLGLTGTTEGAIYSNYVHDKLGSFPKAFERKLHCYFLDFGFKNDPTAFGEACVHNGKLYVRELIYMKGLTDNALIKLFEKLKISKNDMIIADSANPQSIATLNDIHGYYVVAADKPKDSIEAGIAALQDIPIVVVEESPNFITEFENYCYAKKDGVYINKPIEKFNHLLDGLRYYALRFLCKPEIQEYVPKGSIELNLDELDLSQI